MIARKPAEGMDDNDIERRAARGRHVEQALQFRAAVVRAARAGLDEFDGDIPAAGGAIGERLPPLVRDRQVGFRLPPGRDAQVERGTLALSQPSLAFRRDVSHGDLQAAKRL